MTPGIRAWGSVPREEECRGLGSVPLEQEWRGRLPKRSIMEVDHAAGPASTCDHTCRVRLQALTHHRLLVAPASSVKLSSPLSLAPLPPAIREHVQS